MNCLYRYLNLTSPPKSPARVSETLSQDPWRKMFSRTLSSAAAVVSKFVGCGLGAIRLGRTEALRVGVGMIPRGEVGLVFATIGLDLSVGGQRIINDATFSAVVVMVIVTTIVTPPALKWSLGRRTRSSRS